MRFYSSYIHHVLYRLHPSKFNWWNYLEKQQYTFSKLASMDRFCSRLKLWLPSFNSVKKPYLRSAPPPTTVAHLCLRLSCGRHCGPKRLVPNGPAPNGPAPNGPTAGRSWKGYTQSPPPRWASGPWGFRKSFSQLFHWNPGSLPYPAEYLSETFT